MLLTADDLQFLLEELSYETVIEETDEFRFRVQKRTFGYREGRVGKIQAMLSMMLQAKQQEA
jgi:hypothetical protein